MKDWVFLGSETKIVAQRGSRGVDVAQLQGEAVDVVEMGCLGNGQGFEHRP